MDDTILICIIYLDLDDPDDTAVRRVERYTPDIYTLLYWREYLCVIICVYKLGYQKHVYLSYVLSDRLEPVYDW